ncbi:quinone oxidoreductase family protein [Denitratisoma oestradiolicum]|uniref:Alcohol dehydrogenase n=1 Tax=Denitratisoma oestradiolicum TaxID=311182 RepID=A0A6S6Y116_9PROT|nr:NADP-dependent oxidoreductase [Denitratisoma oestradiolicum]TWO79663.1 hypothetical protein CBW56_13905 [Denitratisoma oestradiolicum]CAB1370471.1 Alcohol dehydrogenase [Denitratisoma oestradiolicum]
MPKQMRAVMIDEFGPSNVMRIRLADRPEPGSGQLLIRARYASVNPADWKIRAGLLDRVGADGFPMILGMDVAGVVEAVGTGVADFTPGDRVAALSGMGLQLGLRGTYGEYCCTPAVRAVKLPDHLSFEEGATIPIAAASAASTIIDVAKVKPGDVVLFNGGAGSVGTFGVQFLKLLGAKVAATCSTGNLMRLRGYGIDKLIDYTREDVLDSLRAWVPEGVDCVIDAVGLGSLPANTPEMVKPGGIIACIQTLIKDVDGYDAELAARRNVKIVDNISQTVHVGTPLFQVEGFRQVVAGVASGKIKVPPYKVLPLEEVAQAHDEVEQGHFKGKILLKIGA